MVRPRAASLAVLALASALTCQQLPLDTGALRRGPDLLDGVVVPIHRRALEGYGTWAAGRGFKVAFEQPGRPGFEFVPYAGTHYAERQSLRWRTVSWQLGDRDWTAPEGFRASGRAVHGLRYEYDLGSVVEAYDVSSASVEQTFRVAIRPTKPGPLQVVGAIETPLSCPPQASSHAALVFRDAAGRPLIEYGAATAVDAEGRRFPMTTSFDGASVVLRLDADAVAAATFPLTIDPVLLSSSNSESLGMTDVAAMDRTERWAAYTRVASSGDHDVYLARYDDGWTNRTIRYADLSAATSTVQIDLEASLSSFHDTVGAYLAYEERSATKTEVTVLWAPNASIHHRVTAVTNEHIRNPSLGGGPNASSIALAYDRRYLTSNTVRTALFYDNDFGSSVVTFGTALASTGVEVAPQVVFGSRNSSSICWIETANGRSTIQRRRIIGYPQPFGGVLHGIEPTTTTLYTSTGGVLAQLRGRESSTTTVLTVERVPALGVRSLRTLGIETEGDHSLLFERTLHSGRTYENGSVALDTHNLPIATASFTVLDGIAREIRLARLGSDGRTALDWLVTSAGLPRSPAVTFARVPNGTPGQNGEFLATWALQTASGPLYGEDLNYEPEAFQPRLVSGSRDCAQVDESRDLVEPSLAGHGGFEVVLAEADASSILAVGLTPAAVPLDTLGMPGCDLSLVPLLYSPGGPSQRLPMPTNAYGQSVYVQWILLDPQANPLGLVTSSALELRIR